MICNSFETNRTAKKKKKNRIVNKAVDIIYGI